LHKVHVEDLAASGVLQELGQNILPWCQLNVGRNEERPVVLHMFVVRAPVKENTQGGLSFDGGVLRPDKLDAIPDVDAVAMLGVA
jgi:hypothetical protein